MASKLRQHWAAPSGVPDGDTNGVQDGGSGDGSDTHSSGGGGDDGSGSSDGGGDRHATHITLSEALRAEGWSVEDPCVILVGTCGTVYRSGLAALERLGLAAADSRQLLSELHVSAVLALGDIIAARRQLDSIIARRGVG